MTQRTSGGNNLGISMRRAASVPIVSQTEIDPMKTALPRMLALVTTTALTEMLPELKPGGTGRPVPARVHFKRLVLRAVGRAAGRDRARQLWREWRRG